MSRCIFRPRESFFTSPIERCLDRALNRAFMDIDNTMREVVPTWLDVRVEDQVMSGNSAGKVVNDKEKFGFEVNVSQFRPDELSVNVRDHDLVVEGHHGERNDQAGTIERHFIRKYTIPDDVQMESIGSELTADGVLRINAKKLSIEEAPSRRIPIKAAPKQKATNGKGKKLT